LSEWNSPHFSRSDFACKCGCGFDTVDFELIRSLEYIREHFDKPVIISSGCRCPDWNARSGGSDNSLHLQGRAADIKIHGVSPADVQSLAENMEVGGLGRYVSFTHIDTRSGYARWDG
jgi:uncharacterized protein YcbK (DUF882 family)